MGTATKKCVNCKERKRNEEMLQTPNKQWFCDSRCIAQYANKKYQTKKVKEQRSKDKKKLKELEPRTKKFNRLQRLVNQYVVQVRDINKPCYTCGAENPNIKYDAGHRYHAGRGGGDRRRFVLENIHKQCSVNCNQYGGGMPVQYDDALNKEYGEGFSEHLKCVSNYPELKELFPTWQDIESEIARYRKLLRDNGVKPVV